MSRIRKYLPEWVNEGIISSEQQSQIEQWLDARQGRLPGMVFWISLLAGVLVSLGVMLIIGHNWDNLPHAVRMIISMIPAIVGTGLMLFAAFKRFDNLTWMELGSLLQMIGLGTSIALISQVYHVNGSMESYLFAWLLVFTPTQILLSGRLSLTFYLILSTWFICAAGYNYAPDLRPMHVAWMLTVMFYSIRNLYHSNSSTLFLVRFTWIFPPCFALGFGTLGFHGTDPELMFLAYAALMGWFIMAGENLKSADDRFTNNGLRFFGRLGLMVLFTIFSYKFWWEKVLHEDLPHGKTAFLISPEFWVGIVLLVCLLLYPLMRVDRGAGLRKNPEIPAVLVFGIAFFLLGKYAPLAGMILTNLMMLLLGLYHLRKGISEKSLLWLNYGLLWLAVLLICRFSDMSQGYLARGLFFIGVGMLLFLVNMIVIRKQGKEHSHVG